MSSIAANASPERTNRWLLIAGLVLALITGVLVFALATSGGDDATPGSSIVARDNDVLVARSTLAAGTKLTADMFRTSTFAAEDVVPNAISDSEAIIGQTLTAEMLQGQQLSRVYLTSATTDERADALTFKLPEGHRGIGVAVSKVSTFGGLVVPGDRVDVIVTYELKESAATDAQKYKRISTLMQNVLVVAREQTEVARVNTLPETESESAAPVTGDAIDQRPKDVDTSAGISVVTLALTPEQVQHLVLAESLGEITLVLRKFGEDAPVAIEDLVVPVFD